VLGLQTAVVRQHVGTDRFVMTAHAAVAEHAPTAVYLQARTWKASFIADLPDEFGASSSILIDESGAGVEPAKQRRACTVLFDPRSSSCSVRCRVDSGEQSL
jgi:hypothetical protein